MRIKPMVATGAAVLALTVAACSDKSKTPPDAMSMTQSSSGMAAPMTSSPMGMPMIPAVRSGMFEGLNGKHVVGKVALTGSTLELTEFVSDEGPDLHVYLTKGMTEADVAMGVQINAVKFDQASQSFALKDVKAADYTTVVVHCDKAKVIFGAASLM